MAGALNSDPLFIGLTRPPMIFGVSIKYAALNMIRLKENDFLNVIISTNKSKVYGNLCLQNKYKFEYIILQ